MTHRDEIDKFLFDLAGVLPGCCSSIESVKYTIARIVAEALWPKKDLALTWQNVRTILDKENDILHECNDNAQQVIEVYPKEEGYYREILKRFNEQREQK